MSPVGYPLQPDSSVLRIFILPAQPPVQPSPSKGVLRRLAPAASPFQNSGGMPRTSLRVAPPSPMKLQKCKNQRRDVAHFFARKTSSQRNRLTVMFAVSQKSQPFGFRLFTSGSLSLSLLEKYHKKSQRLIFSTIFFSASQARYAVLSIVNGVSVTYPFLSSITSVSGSSS